MTPQVFQDLLHHLLTRALSHYTMSPTHVVFYVKESSFLFVLSTAQHRFVLKLFPPSSPHFTTQEETCRWTLSLKDSAEHRFLKPLPNKASAFTTVIHHGQSLWKCALFPWVLGTPLHQELSPQKIHQWGRLMGAFHAQSAASPQSHAQKTTTQLNTWNRVFYAYPNKIADSSFGEHYAAVAQKVASTLEALWNTPGPPIRFHGDMHGGNILCRANQMTLLDFDNLTWGFPIQDIAIALLNFRNDPNFPHRCASFKAGYETAASWPQHHEKYLSDLMMGRLMNVANAMLHMQSLDNEEVKSRLRRYAEEFKAYL